MPCAPSRRLIYFLLRFADNADGVALATAARRSNVSGSTLINARRFAAREEAAPAMDRPPEQTARCAAERS